MAQRHDPGGPVGEIFDHDFGDEVVVLLMAPLAAADKAVPLDIERQRFFGFHGLFMSGMDEPLFSIFFRSSAVINGWVLSLATIPARKSFSMSRRIRIHRTVS